MSKASRHHHQAPAAAPKRQTDRLHVYLSSGVLVLACFALFLPLITNYSFYYPFVFLKSILFRAAVQAMTLLYVILAVRYPEYRPRMNRLICALLAYFALMLLSSLPGISIAAWNSWWGDFARMGGMFSQLHLLAYCLVLAHVIKRESEWLLLFTFTLFFGVLVGATAFLQYLKLDFLNPSNPAERIRGATGNAILLASLMVMNLFITFWLISHRDKKTTYALAAKYWLIALASYDAFLVALEVWNVGSGPGILFTGLSLGPVALFGAAVHGLSVLWFFLRRQVWAGQIVLTLLAGYYLFWLYASESRGPFAGLIGALALIAVFYLFTGTGKRAKLMGAGLLLLILSVPSVVWMQRQSAWVQSRPALSRLTRISKEDILSARYWAWKASALAMLDHPVLGWGPENYSSAFDLHFPPQIIDPWESMPWFDRAHNIFFDIGVTGGFLGLASYLILFGLIFAFLVRQWFRTKDPTISLWIGALLLAYLLGGLTTFDTLNTDVIVYLMIAFILYLYQQSGAVQSGEKAHPPVPTPLSDRGWMCIGGTLIVLIAGFWFTVKEPYDSNLLLNLALQNSRSIDNRTKVTRLVYGQGLLDMYKGASDYQTTGRYKVREELANHVSELLEAPDTPESEKVLALKQAIALLQQSVQQDSLNARHYLYLASLANRGFTLLLKEVPAEARLMIEKNLDLVAKAEELSPTRPQVFFEKARTLALLGRFDEQAASIEKGLLLNPPLGGARYFDEVVKAPNIDLYLAYIASGKVDKAAKQWEKIKSLSITLTRADYERIAALLAGKKQYDTMIRIYKEQLAATPNDAQILAQLATTYREIGEIELARETALKAASLAPKSQPAVQAFLESLKTYKKSGN